MFQSFTKPLSVVSPCQILFNSIEWFLRNTRLFEKVEMVKNHPFAIFCMHCIQLGSHSYGENPATFLDFLHLETF